MHTKRSFAFGSASMASARCRAMAESSSASIVWWRGGCAYAKPTRRSPSPLAIVQARATSDAASASSSMAMLSSSH